MKETADPTRATLIRLMQANGTTNGELAEACGCSRQLVSRWVTGSRRIQDEWIPTLAEYYGVSEPLMKYGAATDTDALAAITSGILTALADRGVVHADLTPDQIGHLVAWVFDYYSAHGTLPDDEIFQRVLKLVGVSDVAGAGLAPMKSA